MVLLTLTVLSMSSGAKAPAKPLLKKTTTKTL